MLSATAGAILIALVLWQVFNDLFHPSGKGALSDAIGRSIFSLLRRRRGCLPLAGPLALIVVIGTWVAGLALGFALIYLPTFPDGFRTSTDSVPSQDRHFATVFYYSLETLVTLGYGDLVPARLIVRYLAAIEALVGFGLLSASVSAIILIFLALARMRTLARTLAHLIHAEKRGQLALSFYSESMLASLAHQLTRVRVDFIHFPMVYYFAARDARSSIGTWMNELDRVASVGNASQNPPAVRLAALMLDEALNDFAATLAERFLHMPCAERTQVFRALAADHQVQCN